MLQHFIALNNANILGTSEEKGVSSYILFIDHDL